MMQRLAAMFGSQDSQGGGQFPSNEAAQYALLKPTLGNSGGAGYGVINHGPTSTVYDGAGLVSPYRMHLAQNAAMEPDNLFSEAPNRKSLRELMAALAALRNR